MSTLIPIRAKRTFLSGSLCVQEGAEGVIVVPRGSTLEKELTQELVLVKFDGTKGMTSARPEELELTE